MTDAPTLPAAEPCAQCGTPLAADQHYCLNCGARKAYLSSMLAQRSAQPVSGSHGPLPPRQNTPSMSGSASSPTTLLAGIGVLLVAMGVGILIGRSSSSSAKPLAAQVISVGSSPAAASTAASNQSSPAPETFTSDWPSGSSGYTVQLQTLPEPTTKPSAVSAAESAATGKGASAVGALSSSEYASLKSGSYVIYSGVYKTKAQAKKGLAGEQKTFPGASVIAVSRAPDSSAPGSSSKTGASDSGASLSKPAPPSTVENSKAKSGAEYEQKSKNLPDVVETG